MNALIRDIIEFLKWAHDEANTLLWAIIAAVWAKVRKPLKFTHAPIPDGAPLTEVSRLAIHSLEVQIGINLALMDMLRRGEIEATCRSTSECPDPDEFVFHGVKERAR
jgi:hypothetical protein